jgi:hypothetical protein
MPPVRTPPVRVSCGAGMTAGLEIWRIGAAVALYDRSPDSRFAADVATWNAPLDKKVVASLNAAATKHSKDAA